MKVCFCRNKQGKGLAFILVLLGIAVYGTVLDAQTLNETITLNYIMGVSTPVTGKTPARVITETAQFSGTVTWSPEVLVTFAQSTQYTATITLTVKKGYTLQGVAANFFNVDGASSVHNNANSGVITAVFPQTSGAAVNIAAIQGITVPVGGDTPVTSITETDQYSGTITWTPEVSETFAANTRYTATITLTPKSGYSLEKVAANYFTVAGASSVSNNADSGVITAVFSASETIKIAAITGVTAPVTGKSPVKAITETAQYSGTVTWSPEVTKTFDTDIQYTATITLTPKKGYTLNGVKEGFFTVAGAASVNNDANTGIVTVVFPPTLEKKSVYNEDRKLWTIGASFGSSFAAPLVIGTLHGTLAPFNGSFIDVGVDAGWGINRDDVEYYSLYPFANIALFIPFARRADGNRGGWYLGTGAGVMIANYTFDIAGSIWDTTVAMNFITGFNILSMLDISYTIRTDFKTVNNKVSVGYVYRFN